LGWIAAAHDRATDLLALGEREREPELVGLAWVAFAALAQMRGNYPELERVAGEIERIAARLSNPYFLRIARNARMIVAGVRKEYGRALQHAWAVYEESIGVPFYEAEILQNIGQLLLEAGHPNEARAAFSRVISQPLPARFLLPALGGLALAGAQTRRDATVLWAAAQASAFDVAVTPKYPLAYALVECASACEAIGRPTEARAARERAAQLADSFNFHEIAFRAGESIAAPSRLDAQSQAVVRQVVAHEPDRQPEHVELLGVG
jgi:tetratricopeptide (TPR) repeat protein